MLNGFNGVIIEGLHKVWRKYFVYKYKSQQCHNVQFYRKQKRKIYLQILYEQTIKFLFQIR